MSELDDFIDYTLEQLDKEVRGNLMNYGHDRRRRLTLDEANFLFIRAEGKCENCGIALEDDWHGAHGIAWCNGGATTIEQMQAQCPTCNLKNGTKPQHWINDIELREWQKMAAPKLLETIFRQGFATIHAAPGAGKTILAGFIFKQLYDAGIVKRVVVIVPNRAIIKQWKDTFGRLGIHLDDDPRDNHIEHPLCVGLISSYQALRKITAEAHAKDFSHTSSMLIFDEVHHLADKEPWGRASKIAAGDITKGQIYPEVILNLTGTLFRSGKNKRISTVRYHAIADNALQAVADYSIPTVELIGQDLRAVDVYVYSGQAKLLDLRKEEEIVGEISDLDQVQRKAVIRHAPEHANWREGFIRQALKLHKRHLIAVNNALPLKPLFVAATQKHARLLAEEINKVTDSDFARLIISDEPRSIKELEMAQRERRSLAYVTVNMITEGFDDPNISVIAYCSNVIAPLRVTQIMARAMRLTDYERKSGRYLLANALITDTQELKKAFAAALATTIHEIDNNPEDPATVFHGHGDSSLPRFDLLDLSDPRLEMATILGHEDGNIYKNQLDYYEPICRANGIPLVYTARVAHIAMRGERAPDREETENSVQSRIANPRDLNRSYNSMVGRLSRLMAVHIKHDPRYKDIMEFQALANTAGNLNAKQRTTATKEQLMAIGEWMQQRLKEHQTYCSQEMPDYVLNTWDNEGVKNG